MARERRSPGEAMNDRICLNKCRSLAVKSLQPLFHSRCSLLFSLTQGFNSHPHAKMSGGPGMVIGNMPPPLVPLNLTTTFTPPASCLAPTYTLQGQPKDTFSPPNSNEWATLKRGYRSECFPSSLNSFGSSITGEGYITSYYSPGVCPASYVATALSVYGGYRTFATCCPAR